MRYLFVFGWIGCAVAVARGADPLTVELAPQAKVTAPLVTVADVATVTGGSASARARAGALDLAELKARDGGTTIGRRAVEYRLLLAGIEARVSGPERVAVSRARRAVTVEEVVTATRTEVLRQFAPGTVTAELASPVVVRLPEVPAGERAVITAKPRGRTGDTGRVQMDVGVAAGGETLLSFAMHFDVQPLARGVTAAGGTQFASTEVLIRPRQRVLIQVINGGLKVTAVGEALQSGKLGQTILVQNVDSKQTISARVAGPGVVEPEIRGAP